MLKRERRKSADCLADDFHRILEGLDALRQAIDDLVLLIEALVHFVLETLAEPHELSHCFPLELLDIFVLLLELTVCVVFEGAELQRLVCSLVVDFLLQIVLAVVDFLQDVLLTLDSGLHLSIKLRLKAYSQRKTQWLVSQEVPRQLTVKGVLRLIDALVCFGYTILDLLRDGIFKTVEAVLCVFKLNTVAVSHRIDLSLEVLLERAQLVFKLGPEGLQCVVDSLGLRLSEVPVCLNLALNVLELGLELLLRLNPLHEHDVVVAVHLDQLVVHRGKRHVAVLLPTVACHVLLSELQLGLGDLGLHDFGACSDKGA